MCGRVPDGMVPGRLTQRGGGGSRGARMMTVEASPTMPHGVLKVTGTFFREPAVLDISTL